MYLFLVRFLDSVEDWIGIFLHQQPLVGPVFLLLLEETGIPLPIPGDFYISYVGYRVSQHRIPYFSAYISLFFAVLLGSSILYFLSYHWGAPLIKKFGKYVHLNERKLDYIEEKFRKFGPLAIIFGRHIPGFRVAVTVFSGISKMNYFIFLLSEIISVTFWIAFFLKVGEKLGARTVRLLHHNYSSILFLIIPIIFIVASITLGRFIPESSKRQKK